MIVLNPNSQMNLLGFADYSAPATSTDSAVSASPAVIS